jgi:hypothetical protein
MWQNRKGFAWTQIIMASVSLDVYQAVIKQISTIKTPFYISMTVTTVIAANECNRIFPCDF